MKGNYIMNKLTDLYIKYGSCIDLDTLARIMFHIVDAIYNLFNG